MLKVISMNSVRNFNGKYQVNNSLRLFSDYVLKNSIGVDRVAKGNQLREQLIKNGAIISPNVVLHDYSYQNQGLGLRAIQPIKKYDTIVSIPLNLTISYTNPYISSKIDDNNDTKETKENQVLLLLLSLFTYHHHHHHHHHY